MSHQLAELSATLRVQLPILFSFAVIRWTVWSSAACVCAPCVPRRLRRMVARARRLAMAMGTLLVACAVGFNPPPLLELCSDYSHQRGQGATALLAIAALFLSNRAVASALAISALKGVSDLSSAAVPLSLCAAYAASEVEGDVALYALFAVYTLGHALACHDNTEPSRTHATVLSTIFLLTHVTFRVWVAACGLPLRAWRAARRSRPVRAPRDPRRNVLQGVTAARRA